MTNISETIRKRMALINDESLIRIVTEDAGQYSMDALKIASEEILSRGIDIDSMLKTPADIRENEILTAGISSVPDEADVAAKDIEYAEEYPDMIPYRQNCTDSNVFLIAKEYYKDRAPVEIPQVRPWIRLFARSLDVLLVNTILFVIFKCLRAEAYMKLLGISIVLPVTSLFDGLFVHWWGATPGKWILRIEVTEMDGGRLSYAKAYKRSLMVLLFGEALGIDILSTFTWVLAYFRLKYHGKTYWDHINQTMVVHEKIGGFRALLYILVLALLLCFTASVLHE